MSGSVSYNGPQPSLWEECPYCHETIPAGFLSLHVFTCKACAPEEETETTAGTLPVKKRLQSAATFGLLYGMKPERLRDKLRELKKD